MKNIIIASLLLISCPLLGQKLSKTEQRIKANFEAQERNWSAHDLPAFVSAYKSSAEMISSRGRTIGANNILKNYQKSYTDETMGRLFFDDFSMKKLSSKFFYVVGRYNLEYEGDQKLRQGYFSVIMEKIKGEWLIISDHSS
ncbi:nuclear transport factor 2 family protein [uncultured Arcticibacterium sp.]|uniref:YybH family protein n=1 Tax=uncultured Arcticibacterium sp. TaxID=2173042 RepID=UPI0030FCE8DC